MASGHVGLPSNAELVVSSMGVIVENYGDLDRGLERLRESPSDRSANEGRD